MDLFSFHGRIGRSDWWVGNIALAVLQGLILVVGGMMLRPLLARFLAADQVALVTSNLAFITTLLFLWPITSISVRRSHDRDMSGWWYGAFLSFQMITNVWANAAWVDLAPTLPLVAVMAVAAINILAGLYFLVVLGFLPGTPQTNDYGPPPRGFRVDYQAPSADQL